MSLSFPDHPWLSALLGDAEMAASLSVEAELTAILRFEEVLANEASRLGLIPLAAAEAIITALRVYQSDPGLLRQGMARDGVVIPVLIADLRTRIAPEHRGFLHLGATSQDVIDSALVMRLASVTSILQNRLQSAVQSLDRCARVRGQGRLQGYTRMQSALPITWDDKVASWRAPLIRHTERLGEILPRLLTLQLGGAVGTREKYGEHGPALAAAMAESLGLRGASQPWHNARDNIAEFASWLSLVSGSLGKIGQDVGLLAQMGAISLPGGTSSAMPGKNNPVSAEVLVTLARFNATQLSGMHQALLHEQERSGAAWTLEWMLLPQMIVAAGCAFAHAQVLISDLASM